VARLLGKRAPFGNRSIATASQSTVRSAGHDPKRCTNLTSEKSQNAQECRPLGSLTDYRIPACSRSCEAGLEDVEELVIFRSRRRAPPFPGAAHLWAMSFRNHAISLLSRDCARVRRHSGTAQLTRFLLPDESRPGAKQTSVRRMLEQPRRRRAVMTFGMEESLSTISS